MSATDTKQEGIEGAATPTPAPRPLRILQIGTGFPGWGGTELHLINLAEQLTQRGHSVTVAARPEKFVEQEAKKRNLPTFAATVERQWDFKDASKLLTYMRQEKFDVVHVHWSTDYVVAPYMAKRAGVPVVAMSRHSPYPLKSAIGRWLYDKVLFDRIIALSESVRQTIVGQGLRPEQVVTIHHGTDTDAFRHTTKPPAEVRAEWGVPENAFLVGMVGRIADEKGWRTFLEAIAKATRQSETVPIYAVLIGDGPEGEEAKALSAQLGLDTRLTFAGFRSDVNNAINSLNTLVLASTWAEPCAAVVQQAMALGKSVIGTDIGGTPEMVAGNQTGLLVSPGDANALAKAILALASDPARCVTMGAAGKERVEALFTLRRMTDKNESLYYEILKKKGRV